jgi:hypothetical protein
VVNRSKPIRATPTVSQRIQKIKTSATGPELRIRRAIRQRKLETPPRPITFSAGLMSCYPLSGLPYSFMVVYGMDAHFVYQSLNETNIGGAKRSLQFDRGI